MYAHDCIGEDHAAQLLDAYRCAFISEDPQYQNCDTHEAKLGGSALENKL